MRRVTEIWTVAEAAEFVSKPRPQAWAIDCETSGIDLDSTSASNPTAGRIVCFSLANRDEAVFVWNDDPGVMRMFIPWFKDRRFIGHNINSFDWHMFRAYGAELTVALDTLRLHRLLFTEKGTLHGLKDLTAHYLPHLAYDGGFMDLFSRVDGQTIVTDVLEKKTRKIDGVKVPLLLGTSFTKLRKRRVPIDLYDIPTTYPHLVRTLVDYAIKDAVACYELALLLKEKACLTPTCSISTTESGNPPLTQLAPWKDGASLSTEPHIAKVPPSRLKPSKPQPRPGTKCPTVRITSHPSKLKSSFMNS